MQLDRISARIAPRSAWQAMDLGVRLYQQWFRPLTRTWLVFSLLPCALILWLFGSDNIAWGLFLCWWLKPLWERPLLDYAAHAMFDDHPDLASQLKRWRSHTLSGIAPWLLWRRLDPSRAFHLPVTQLENQRGERYRKRVQALAMGPSNHGATLTVLMIHIEQFIAFGLVMLVMMLQPDQYYLSEVSWLQDTSDEAMWLSTLCWYLALMICEPLYVCCGFALYLNKRTWLEGWDLELGLRRIGARRTQRRTSSLSVLLVLLLPLLLMTPHRSLASDATDAAPLDTRQQAIDILASPAFMPMSIEDSWRLRNQDETGDEDDGDDSESWLSKLLKYFIEQWFGDGEQADADGIDLPSLADVFRFLLWVIVVSLLIWLAIKAPGWLRQLPDTRRRSRPRTHLAGLDIRPESLPDDLQSAVNQALRQHKHREALSLLYRASLARLVSLIPDGLAAGATETECLRALQSSQGAHPGVQFLARLTPVWISTAWAHRPPSEADISALARAWQQAFDGGGAE